MTKKIITRHIFPPIPIRAFDWIAYYDGEEEDGIHGSGATEAEALADLASLSEPDEAQPPARLPGLTHAEMVDHFPILRGERYGFEKDRIIDPAQFSHRAQAHGWGAHRCASFVLSLLGYTPPQRFTLDALLSHIDGEHRKAAVALFAAVAERGVR